MRQLAAILVALPVALVQAQTRATNTTASNAQAAPTQAESVDHSAARYWGLTIDDYRRYQALMKGVRGAVSDPRISPIEVLGIHARDDAERRKYAQMFARLMDEDTQRVLQFQLEYDRAFRRLHPKLLVLDFETSGGNPRSAMTPAVAGIPAASPFAGTSVAAAMTRAPSIAAGDRILVFAREACSACDELVQRATAAARQGVTVDLYLVGARSTDDVQGYARRVAIDPTLVSSGGITLNLDAGTFSRVLPKQPELPAVVRKRGESLAQIAPAEL